MQWPEKNSQYNGQIRTVNTMTKRRRTVNTMARRIRTVNTMAKRKNQTKKQPIIGKTLNKQTKDQVTRTPLNRGMNAGAPEW